MKTVFVDESGATGLVDFDSQPVFALSAVCIEEDDARMLCEDLLPRRMTGLSELKHSRLVGRAYAPIQNGLVGLQTQVLKRFPAYSYCVDKRYSALMSLCADCIPGESPQVLLLPQFAMALYSKWEMLSDAFDLQGVLHSYYDAVTCGNIDEISCKFEMFIEKVNDALGKCCDEDLHSALDGIARCEEACVNEFKASVGPHDLSQRCIVGIVAEMAQELNEPFRLILDASYHDAMVDSIVSLLRFKFPRIVVDSGNSKNYHGLQLADILAGGARFAAELAYFRGIEHEHHSAYREKILSLYKESRRMLWCPPSTPPNMLQAVSSLIRQEAWR